MLALHHPFAWIVFMLIVDTISAVTLIAVAEARGQSKLFGLWAVLGFAGLIAGLLIMMAIPNRQPPQAPMQPSA